MSVVFNFRDTVCFELSELNRNLMTNVYIYFFIHFHDFFPLILEPNIAWGIAPHTNVILIILLVVVVVVVVLLCQ